MTRLGLQHHDGPLATLGAGCWTLDSKGRARALILWSCPDCAAYDIDPVTVASNGDVAEELFCQTPSCRFSAMLRLEGWTAAKFDHGGAT